eukprot:6189234-Pleurochrysis_carterae.AAC.1
MKHAMLVRSDSPRGFPYQLADPPSAQARKRPTCQRLRVTDRWRVRHTERLTASGKKRDETRQGNTAETERGGEQGTSELAGYKSVRRVQVSSQGTQVSSQGTSELA